MGGLVTGNVKEIINYLLKLDIDKQYEIEVKEYKQKRSLDSNSYCWVLINKIANAMRISKEDVYFKMLKDYGQSDLIKIKSIVNPQDYFKYYEKVNDKDKYTYYKIYKGSSLFNQEEMSILIDGIVEEAKQLGIETMTPVEIANLKSMWGKNE